MHFYVVLRQQFNKNICFNNFKKVESEVVDFFVFSHVRMMGYFSLG